MLLRHRIALAAALLALPVAMLAAPAPVIGIRAWEQDGGVHVSWQALPESERITFYKVAFSSQSILQNGGLYEDFDIAAGQVSEHVFADVPMSPALFFSVVAVNDRGEESAAFAEEFQLTRIPNSEQRGEEASIALISAEAISSTGILLTFSSRIDIRDEDAASAITIVDGSGTVLPVTLLILSGQTVTLHTMPQDPVKVYRAVAKDVYSIREDGVLLTLDPEQSTLLFAGFVAPVAAPSVIPPSTTAATPVTTAQPLPGSQTLQLRAEANGAGQYTVEGVWGATEAAAMYFVSQTLDHGRTFSSPYTVPASSQGVRIPSVPPGEFGLRVQAVRDDGTVLGGALGFIQLGTNQATPWTADAARPSRGPATPAPISTVATPKGLTQSGMGIAATLALAGIAGGVSIIRRKRMV